MNMNDYLTINPKNPLNKKHINLQKESQIFHHSLYHCLLSDRIFTMIKNELIIAICRFLRKFNTIDSSILHR